MSRRYTFDRSKIRSGRQRDWKVGEPVFVCERGGRNILCWVVVATERVVICEQTPALDVEADGELNHESLVRSAVPVVEYRRTKS